MPMRLGREGGRADEDPGIDDCAPVEVSRFYKTDVRPQESDRPKIGIFKDTRLD